jgi:hypothetical protein
MFCDPLDSPFKAGLGPQPGRLMGRFPYVRGTTIDHLSAVRVTMFGLYFT